MIPLTMDLPPTGEESIAYTTTVDDQTRYAFSNTAYYRHTADREEDIIRYDTQLQLRRQFDRLMNKLQDEWQTYREHYSGVDFREVQDITSKLAATLVHTSPEKMSVELTADATVFFTCIYPGINAYVEAHFDPVEATEVVINVYKNKQAVYAYGDTLAESLQAFYSFLNQR